VLFIVPDGAGSTPLRSLLKKKKFKQSFKASRMVELDDFTHEINPQRELR